LDEDSLENCTYQIGASAENFIHACIVGSNKGFTNLDGTNPIRDGSGEYKNVF
jgi:hypothetical protein